MFLKLNAKSEFSLDNVSEENKASIKPPVESSIEFKNYAVQIKEIQDKTVCKRVWFWTIFINGKSTKNGFVITSK